MPSVPSRSFVPERSKRSFFCRPWVILLLAVLLVALLVTVTSGQTIQVPCYYPLGTQIGTPVWTGLPFPRYTPPTTGSAGSYYSRPVVPYHYFLVPGPPIPTIVLPHHYAPVQIPKTRPYQLIPNNQRKRIIKPEEYYPRR